jgi:WXG100 family type VII secretion target
MGDRLRLEYDSLTKIAGSFAQEANDLEQMVRRIANMADNVQRAGWMGIAAAQFFGAHAELLDPATWKMIALLYDTSNLINQLVQNFRSVEEQVAELFRRPPDPAIGLLKWAIQFNLDHLLELDEMGVMDTVNSTLKTAAENFYHNKMREIMGRDIPISPPPGEKGYQEFYPKEKVLIVETFSELPKTMRDKAVIDNLYRVDKFGDNTAANYNVMGDITISGAVLNQGMQQRYSVSSSDQAFQAVLLHELTHSIQFNADGSHSKLLTDYAAEFGWQQGPGGNWKYTGDVDHLPGHDNPSTWYKATGENPLEDMAEAVTFYRYAPDRLSQARYDWVRDNVYDGREFK